MKLWGVGGKLAGSRTERERKEIKKEIKKERNKERTCLE
jgi:hypothetical protein